MIPQEQQAAAEKMIVAMEMIGVEADKFPGGITAVFDWPTVSEMFDEAGPLLPDPIEPAQLSFDF